MNLFWETRRLTQAREDHLICFIATALEVDSGFRAAYEKRILDRLARADGRPSLASVAIQVAFKDQHSQVDMLLDLSDGRRVACEHKMGAAETSQDTSDGRVGQLERYLGLPGVDAVAYFRASLQPPADRVLAHPRDLRPVTAPHFTWGDLYEPLVAGREPISAWLRAAFERLGFTPPLPHIGELRPDGTEEDRKNQRNFGKLWHSARSYLPARWKVQTGSRCELYLTPKTRTQVSLVYVSPLAQGGTLLRVRAHTDASSAAEVRRRFETVTPTLAVQPELREGTRSNDSLR